MKVKTLHAHNNATLGYPYEKRVGSVYELPDAEAETLIRSKLVEKHSSETAKKES